MGPFPWEIEEFEANLYTSVNVPKLLAPFFRNKGGEIEVSTYDDGDRRMEVEIDRLSVPNGATVSAIVDGNVVCELQVNRGRGRMVLRSSKGDTIPAVSSGSMAEIRYNGEMLLRGHSGGTEPSNASVDPYGRLQSQDEATRMRATD